MPVRERPRSRRRVFAALVLPLLLHAAVLHLASRPAAAASWRQPAFSASRSAFNPRETEIDAGNVATLVERWRVAGIGAQGSPVVGGGRVFTASGTEMVALALDDGAEQWRKTLVSSDECCNVYHPVLTPDGLVTAQVGWIGGGGTARFDPVAGTFTYGAQLHTGELHRAVTGNDVFSVGFTYGSGGPLLYTLFPYGGLIYFGGLSSTTINGLAVRGDRAYVAFGNTLQAFDLASCPDPIVTFMTFCSPSWTKTLSQRVGMPVAFRDSVAVVSADGLLEVHAAANGDLEWSATVGAGIGHAPAVAKRRIFVPTERGVIVAFDSRGCGAATCAPVERFRLGSPATGQPVVAGKVLYAGTKDGRIVAFRAAGCPEAACDPLLDVDLGGGAIVAGPIVVDGTVIAGTADGQLVALGLPLPD
jgi:outer membrane protein assembly factor BamB